MVVDLAIDGQRHGFLVVDQRLRARVCAIVSFRLGIAWSCDRIPTPTMLRRSWTKTAQSQRVVLAPATPGGPTGIVRDPVATCAVSVIAFRGAWSRGVLTPVWAPMPDAVAVSQ